MQRTQMRTVFVHFSCLHFKKDLFHLQQFNILLHDCNAVRTVVLSLIGIYLVDICKIPEQHNSCKSKEEEKDER